MRVRELKALVNLYNHIHLQSQNVAIYSWRSYYARGFFDKARLHISSLALLIETSSKKDAQQIDIGGICSLARCIIESHNAYHYLLEARLDQKEQEFRHDLFLINHTADLERIHNELGILPDELSTFTRLSSLKDALTRLEHNPSFQSLPPEIKRKARAGRTPYLTERYGGTRPLPPNIESGIYKLFSHSVHSFGLGINYFGNGHHSVAGAVNLLALSVDVSLVYGARIAKKYLSSRRKAMSNISDADRTTILELCNSNELRLLLMDLASQSSI